MVGRIEVKNLGAKISSHLGHLFVLLHRHVLDFDFEKLCSVSLSHINIYACLVCGKYFQGKSNSLHSQPLLFGEVLSFQEKINLKNTHKKTHFSCNAMQWNGKVNDFLTMWRETVLCRLVSVLYAKERFWWEYVSVRMWQYIIHRGPSFQ